MNNLKSFLKIFIAIAIDIENSLLLQKSKFSEWIPLSWVMVQP